MYSGNGEMIVRIDVHERELPTPPTAAGQSIVIVPPTPEGERLDESEMSF